MSSIEERLMADIAAVTRGVAMTESDLRDARNNVDERIDSTRRRDRRRAIVAAAAAAVVIPILGFAAVQTLNNDDRTAPPAGQGPTSDSDADFLTGEVPTSYGPKGVWRVDGGTSLLRVQLDGKVSLDSRGRLYSGSVFGTYTIAGDLISVKVDFGLAGCAVGEQFAMRASRPEAGVLHVVQVKPVPSGCLPEQAERWVLQQVLPPRNEDLAGLDFSGDDFKPLTNPSALHGDWMAQGGGHILELTPAGIYFVAAESGDSVDIGHWTFDRSSSQLRLVSDISPQCGDDGDRLVLGDLRYADSNPAAAFRGTVLQNTCGGAWTPDVWILIPHVGS